MTKQTPIVTSPLFMGDRKEAKIIPLHSKEQVKEIRSQQLQEAAVHLALAALWHDRQFSIKETNAFKKLIAEHFDEKKIGKKQFIELVERICLAKRHAAKEKGKQAPPPIDWLKELKGQRNTANEYGKGTILLAKAIHEYTVTQSRFVFYKYRRLLIGQGQPELIQIFYNTIVHRQFLN